MARDGCHRAGPYTPRPSACRLRLERAESLDWAADLWVARRTLEGIGGCLGGTEDAWAGALSRLRVVISVNFKFVVMKGPAFCIDSCGGFVLSRAFEQAIGRPATPQLWCAKAEEGYGLVEAAGHHGHCKGRALDTLALVKPRQWTVVVVVPATATLRAAAGSC